MAGQEPSEDQYATKLYRGYVLALLTAVNFFYYLDRNVVLVTQELLKEEFGLSDTQLGLMIGPAYAVSFAVAGLALGWAVDRVNRRRMLAAVVAVWSALTAFCGVADGFRQLVLARIGLAAAESGGAPAALSIICDIYPAERRAGPASIYYSGSAIGIIVSFLVGGMVAAEFGWRAVFLLYGAPGLLLGLLVLLTLKDPVVAPVRPEGKAGGFLGSLRALVRDPVLIAVYLGSALYTLSMGAVGSWLMSFLVRVHGVDLKTGGMIIAGALGVFGLVGALLFGRLSDMARRLGPGGPLFVIAGAALINMVFGLGAVMSGQLWLAVGCLCVWGATTIAYSGPANAVIGHRAPPGARGLSLALFSIIANLIGAGLGPLAVGMLSDVVAGVYGKASIRPALMALLVVQLLTAGVFVIGAVLSGRPANQMEKHP